MTAYWEAFWRLVYPAACGVCKTLLELEEKGLCRRCESRLKALCFSPEDSILPDRFEALDGGWALYPYQSPVKEILTAVKFARKRWLLRAFRDELKTLVAALTGEHRYDRIVPIPMDSRRLLEREFNQSELIAEYAAQSSGLPVCRNLLGKRRHTPAQSLLSRDQRRTNMRGAFHIRKSGAIRGRRVLLVDDILTTGSTAEEAARLLKEHGAARVDVLALARTHQEN